MSFWFLFYFLLIPVDCSYLENMESIHRELASSNPTWNRVVTFVLESSRTHPKQDLGRAKDGECCLTDRSGWWCRRQRNHRRAGDLHPVGDNLVSDQLGHRSERPSELLYEATDWASKSCRITTTSTTTDQQTEVDSDSPVVMDDVNRMMRHHVDLPAIFSILINFGRNEYYQFLLSMLDYMEEEHGCSSGFVWDPFASACRRIYCGPSAYDGFLEEYCANKTDQMDSEWRMTYIMELDVIQLTLYADALYDNETLTDEDLLAIIEESFTRAFASFVGISPDRIDNVNVQFTNQSSRGSQTLRSVAVDFWLSQAVYGSDEPTIDAVVALMGSLIVQDQLIVVMDQVTVQLIGLHEQPLPSETDSFANWCRGGVISIYTNDEFVLDVNNNTETNQTELIVYIKATETWYGSGEYMADLFFYGTSESSVSLSGSVAVCENRSVLLDTTCTMIHLNESEYIFLDNNTVLYNGSIPFIGPVLHPGEYESLPDGTLAVCLYLDVEWPAGLIIESYITVVLMSISIVAMLATIVTYLFFAELRNLAGLAVMNLCITTALFQICLMIGMSISVHQEAELCVAASIVVHYEGLASFFWTNVMAADLYLTLGRWSAAPRSPSKILPRYALYAYGLPLIIVSISSAINFCGCTGDFTVDYGRVFCWINNPTANMIFFGLPLALALIANVVLFIITVTIIRRSSTCHGCTRMQKALCQLKLYARMSTVMGFAWIFAFISACFDPATPAGMVFTFIYVILNAMGGLFIFVAFTCNRRVCNLYQEWWAKRSHLKRSGTETGSSVTSRTSGTSRKTSLQTSQNRPRRQMKTVSVETLSSEVSSSSSSPSITASHEPALYM